MMRRLSVRSKLLLVLLVLALFMGAGAALQVRSALLQMAGAELDKRGLSIAGDLAERVTDPLLTRSVLDVRQILLDTMANNPDVRYALVLDGQGRLVAHTFIGGFPRDLLTQRSTEEPLVLLASEEGLLHDAAAPIVNGLAGYVRVGLTQAHLVASLGRVQRQQIIGVTLLGLLALVAAYWAIARLLVRLQQLRDAALAVGQGDLTQRVAPGAADELGDLAVAFNEMTQQLATNRAALQAKEQARTELLQRVLTAQEEERGRISRELHDGVGQALTGLIVGLKVLRTEVETAPAPHVESLRSLAAETLDSVRRLSRDLRPAVLDDIGLVPALRRYVTEFERIHGIQGTLEVLGESRLPAALETTLYRVVQEALTNVARHSGARHFGVVLDLRAPFAQAIVEDDGRGFDPESPREGLGLAGIAERAALVGGQMTIESRPGGGATIYVKVPVEEGEQRADSDRG